MEFWPSGWQELVELLRLDLLGAVLLAVLYGGAVGLEREIQGKPAGLRTNILICVGSTLFTQLSMGMVVGSPAGDPSRIAAQIVTGVGFIGAGTILHSRGEVTGLTSAATIWVVAAIGVALGAGATFEATGVTLLLIFVLAPLGRIEKYLRVRSEVSHLRVQVAPDPEEIRRVESTVREAGLEIMETRSEIGDDDRITVFITARGPERLHDKARLALLRASGAYQLTVQDPGRE